MTTIEIKGQPGYDSTNRAFLNVSARARLNGRNLDYQEVLLAHYKLFVTDDGEVQLIGGPDGDEVLFSEILPTVIVCSECAGDGCDWCGGAGLEIVENTSEKMEA